MFQTTPFASIDMSASPPSPFALCSINVLPKPRLAGARDGTAALLPAQAEHGVGCGPANLHHSPHGQQRSVFDRVRAKLVEHERHVQGQLRLEMDRRTGGVDPRFVDGSDQQLIANQIEQTDAAPGRRAQHRMDARERLDAAGEAAREFIRILGPLEREMRDRLHVRERVLAR
jgi:hypothetical protein